MISSENKQTIIFIIVAFIFSFIMRLIWVYQFNDVSEFKFNDQFMINTNDGYYWAEGARDILNGISQNNDSSPTSSSISNLTAYLFKFLPFSFETIIFYMPAFFSSLIVIPIILIAKSIQKIEMGFIAALLASISWSYYNRTMVGYYDTDFLNIVFPMILLWSIIWAIKTKEDKYLLFTAFDILLYRWWYPQSYSLEFAFFVLIAVYLVYEIYKNKSNKLYENKKVFYTIQLLSLMLIAMIQLDVTLRFMLVLGYFMLFRQARWHKHLYIMFIMVLTLFATSGGLNPIIGQLKNYVFKDVLLITGDNIQLHYFTVMQTIKEASTIDFLTLANRISGNMVIFILSILGYSWLCIRSPIMLFGLPMIGLGLLAYSGGLRFTIYAIPILSLGIAFLINELSTQIKDKRLKIVFIVLCTLGILSPNVKHIIDYRIPTVFTQSEVNVLNNIKKVVSRDDYVISWWDYGYAIRYYADVKTLSDGGKHNGSVNFPIAFSILSDSKLSAKMLRLDVEYSELQFNLDKDDTSKYKTNIENMMFDYGYKNTNTFLDNLENEILLPKKTREIYLYLPYKMLNILPTISMFSNIDLMTGKSRKENFFYLTNDFQDNGNKILLGNDIFIDKNKGTIFIQGQVVSINKFIVTHYDNSKELMKNIQFLNNEGELNIIYMKNYNRFLIVDNDMYNSTYIQLFVLENYDKKIYEPIALTPHTKVFRLKI
jgi:undecaprenyl-diphosphooligosaccharide--protein glycosyltransferase